MPGADGPRPAAGRRPRAAGDERPLRIAYCVGEERGALRLFLRALRRLPDDLDWEAAIWLERPAERPRDLAARSATGSPCCGPADCAPGELIARRRRRSCVASGGPPRRSLRWSARRSPPGRSPSPRTSPSTTSSSATATRGLLFPPGDPVTLAGQLARLCSEPRRCEGASRAGREREARRWSDVADELEEIYRRLAARRHDPAGNPAVRQRIAAARAGRRRPAHAHRPLAGLRDAGRRAPLDGARARARGDRDHRPQRGLGGARGARAGGGDGGTKIIVAEEVKTAEQGEVIGLFLEEKIQRGLTMAETIAEIQPPGRPGLRAASVRPAALGPRLRAPARHRRGHRHPRGLQPAGRAHRVQRGGRALRRQVPDRPRRRLRQPRRPGPRQREDPPARLRRARGVPRVDARRGHRPQAQEPDLRPGAEVPADGRRPRRANGASRGAQAGKK